MVIGNSRPTSTMGASAVSVSVISKALSASVLLPYSALVMEKLPPFRVLVTVTPSVVLVLTSPAAPADMVLMLASDTLTDA